MKQIKIILALLLLTQVANSKCPVFRLKQSFQVLDLTQKPIKDAYVKWGENKYAFSDSNGIVNISYWSREKIDSVSFSVLGFEKKKIKLNYADSTIKVFLLYKMLDKVEIFSTNQKGFYCRRTGCSISYKVKDSSITIIKKDTIRPKLFIEPKLSFNLYPNPIQKNGLLNIKLEKTGIYKLEIFDMLGKILSTSYINNEAKTNHPIQLNKNMMAGNYFVKLTNVSTNEMITEKFIIQ